MDRLDRCRRSWSARLDRLTAYVEKEIMSDRTALAARPGLRLERRLGAPPDKVFSAWTRPAEIARWFGPSGAHSVTAEADARVGGRYRIAFRTRDGERSEVGGVYLEIVPNEKLAFTWAWHSTPERESRVTVLLEGDAGGTLLTLTHEQFFDEAARDRHRMGWAATLDKLEALLT